MKALKIIPVMLVAILGINPSYAQKSGFPPNNIGKMLSLYLDIKNALIRNDGTTAKIKANELHQILVTRPDKGLMPRQVYVLADNLQVLIDNSREIGYTVDENMQRRYLPNLTTGMYNVIKGLRVNKTRVYKQYCPINKAYWLSESPVIQNPYYNYDGWGKKGQTTEILPVTILAD